MPPHNRHKNEKKQPAAPATSAPAPRKNKYRESDRKLKKTVRIIGAIGASVVLLILFGAILFDLFVPNSHRQPAKIPTAFVAEQNLTKEGILNSVVESFDALFTDSNNSFVRGVGEEFRARGYRVKHPIVMIPGFVTSGLDVWKAPACAGKLMRSRLWVDPLLVTTGVLKDPSCFLSVMSLNQTTGLDSTHSKLRAAEGFPSADYIAAGYWVWAPIIDNLVELGYDTDNMAMASYDWRLALHHLEERDAFFSGIKSKVETFHKMHKEKVVLISHSLGGLVTYFFLQWVTHDPAGGGLDWVEKHLHASVNIAPAMLGSPKSLAVTLSCECKDTAIFGHMDWHVWKSINLLLPPSERLALWRSWPGGHALIPKGGDLVWGNTTHAADDILQGNVTAETPSYGVIFCVRNITGGDDEFNATKHNANASLTLLTMDGALDLLRKESPQSFKLADEWMKFGAKASDFTDDAHTKHFSYWTNPLESQLPNAPSHTIYSLYGVGIPTERGFHYEFDQVRQDDGDNNTLAYVLDANLNGAKVARGIHLGDGDLTVPLISLGYVGYSAWKHKRFNPHGVKSVVKEYQHHPTLFSLRGGPATANHVDILGNHEVIADVLKVVTNSDTEPAVLELEEGVAPVNAFTTAIFQDSSVRERIVSRLPEIAAEIDRKLNLKHGVCATNEQP